MKRESHSNLYGGEVYHTACSLLVISKNSCSKLHGQKVYDLIVLSYNNAPEIADASSELVERDGEIPLLPP